MKKPKQPLKPTPAPKEQVQASNPFELSDFDKNLKKMLETKKGK
jgi:hypothetical protein